MGKGSRYLSLYRPQKLKKNATTELECVSSDKKEMQSVETHQIFWLATIIFKNIMKTALQTIGSCYEFYFVNDKLFSHWSLE